MKRKLNIDRKNNLNRSSKHLKIRSRISPERLQEEVKVQDGIRGVWEEDIRGREFVSVISQKVPCRLLKWRV